MSWMRLFVNNMHIIKCFLHCVEELEAVKISQAQIAELHRLQNEVAEKESAEAELKQQLTSIQGDKTQLKVSLQEKEGEYVL